MICSYKIGIAFDNVRWHSRIKKLIVIQVGAYISFSIEWATLNSASFMTPMYGIESNAFAAVTTYGLDVFSVHESTARILDFKPHFLCVTNLGKPFALSLSFSLYFNYCLESNSTDNWLDYKWKWFEAFNAAWSHIGNGKMGFMGSGPKWCENTFVHILIVICPNNISNGMFLHVSGGERVCFWDSMANFGNGTENQ